MNTIDHSTLLFRLHSDFGVSGAALSWIHTYLTDRKQRVTVGHCNSPVTTVLSGVPQGSVLGPLLFTSYISPLGHLINSFGVSHQQYADDTQLFISIPSTSRITPINQLESCLSAIHHWFCLNGLSLNPDKSDAIWFTTPQRARSFVPAISINVAGTAVSISNTITTLGVTLDSHLTFDSHVTALSKSCNFHIRALRHIRKSLTEDMAHSIAVALVSSRLDYANSILYGISKSNILKLQRIQNHLAKLVTQNYHISSSATIQSLHWLPIKHRIDFKISTLTYKLLHSHTPPYLASTLHTSNPVRNLRSGNLDLLHQPFSSSAIGSRAFHVAAPAIWNSIPLNIRNSPSISSFRRHLKTHLFAVAD